ncbi:uncharacterized protein H6S33_001325 [Morchella sextelata]|uniref:uncharacterized protein n=1 Tax=Morchella sextelata TaxID=1174677 RepID=UPI001D05A3CB|nr:uncharacterized protein H6S33_001325 [Morchella sextelata]KAH0609097.1 hypothetical protein H6S33_001325 [Morchella sextelata]
MSNYSADIVGVAEREVLGEVPNFNENKPRHKEAAETLLALGESRGSTNEDLHGNLGPISSESLQTTNAPVDVESNETIVPAASLPESHTTRSGRTNDISLEIKQIVSAASGTPSPQYKQPGPSTGPTTVNSFSTPTTSQTEKRPRAAPGEKKFLCQVENCGKGYTTNRALKTHGKVHLDNTQSHECNKCDKPFPTKAALNKHKSTDHRGEFKCSLCDKYFGLRAGIRKHIQNDHPEVDVADTLVGIHLRQEFGRAVSIFLCNVCPCWNTDKYFFKTHVAKRHKSQGTAATTEKCLAESKERDDARFNSYTCTLCRWRTPHMEAIRDHVEAAHPSEDKYRVSAAILGTMKVEEIPYERVDKRYKCHHCDRYVGKSDHALFLHIKERHEEWDVYELQLRSLMGMDSADLLPQRGVPWFECNFCQQSRRRLANIKHHIRRVHKDDRTNFKDNSGGQPSFWTELSEAESKVLEEVEANRRRKLGISDDKDSEDGEDGENSGEDEDEDEDEDGDDEDGNGGDEDGNGDENGDEEPIRKFRKVENIRQSKGLSKSG